MKASVIFSLVTLFAAPAFASGGSHPGACRADSSTIAQEGIGATDDAAKNDATQRIESSLADFAADCRARGGTFVRCDIKTTKDWEEHGYHYVTAEARFECQE